MRSVFIRIADVVLSVEFPSTFSNFIEILFPDFEEKKLNQVGIEFSVIDHSDDTFEILENGKSICKDLTVNNAALGLMNEVVRSVAEHSDNFIAVHAAAVKKNNIAVVIPGNTGSGKTSLSAWLVSQGYQYLTDELVLFSLENTNFQAFYRPLNVKAEGLKAVRPLLKNFIEDQEISTKSIIVWPAGFIGERVEKSKPAKANLFVFPSYRAEADLKIEVLTPAQVGLELMASNVNARNLENHGFKEMANIARQVPGFRLVYSDFEQLQGLLLELIESLGSEAVDKKFLSKLLRSANVSTKPQVGIKESKKCTIPEPTEKLAKKKLCIGMATYDDYDGVYFSAQAIRLYHPEVADDTEIMVLDNHPTGKCANDLKVLDSKIKNYRYIPVVEKTGTAIRDMIFENANADYVLCIDCHVFIEPGSIKKLIDYFDVNPQCNDLLQGPMYSDNLKDLSTHFKPVWNKGMYGIWGTDQRAEHVDAPVFEIPMQGLGLFACSKESWPGFNKKFRGFGGEEGYIHEKFRQAGGKILCLPFLRWMHRFARPMGVPYPINWQDRIRNYLIGFTELGLDTQPIIEHFNDHLNESVTADVVKAFENEFGKLA